MSTSHNGKPLAISVTNEPEGFPDYRCLSASVNRACAKWLERKIGYKPVFGGSQGLRAKYKTIRKPL